MKDLFQRGMAYMDGVGVEQDVEKGLGLILQAAQQGYADAQYFLGIYNFKMIQDIPTAVGWFQKAAQQGHENARVVLEEAGLF